MLSIVRMPRFVFLLCISGCALSVCAQETYSSYSEKSFPDNVYFGDTHLHTKLSYDGRGEPDDAYRFAKGHAILDKEGIKRRLRRPLDFLVVADHGVGMGLFSGLDRKKELVRLSVEPASNKYQAWVEKFIRLDQLTIESHDQAFNKLRVEAIMGEVAVGGKQFQRSVWGEVTRRADRYNQPGVFTAFSGYEWTPLQIGQAHRVVVFKDDAEKVSQVRPFTRQDSEEPEDLWAYLAHYQQTSGGDALAILHGSNLSFGGREAFALTTSDTKPLSADYARMRQRWEPLVEATQTKGDSETHPGLSPEDEFADFERWNTWLGSHYRQDKLDPDMMSMVASAGSPERLPYRYARSGLKLGLAQKSTLGVNPFKFGMIGSTDVHDAMSSAEEDNYMFPYKERVTEYASRARWEKAAAGYAAVWATENTREALFSAMKRKEVYATTGTRIRLRFFGGWDFEKDDAWSPQLARIGYSGGVPMGGDLAHAPVGRAPKFLIQVVKDPDGANLDRAQVIKGWQDEAGELHEKVYDVALSDERKENWRGRIKPVGSTVDVPRATYNNSIGNSELAVVWQDPDFNPDQLAFYYLRVLEIPTPRWTAYDAAYFQLQPLPEEITMTMQERAYSSPIWYNP